MAQVFFLLPLRLVAHLLRFLSLLCPPIYPFFVLYISASIFKLDRGRGGEGRGVLTGTGSYGTFASIISGGTEGKTGGGERMVWWFSCTKLIFFLCLSVFSLPIPPSPVLSLHVDFWVFHCAVPLNEALCCCFLTCMNQMSDAESRFRSRLNL